jgi:outer membrane lipoprotein carrier protein
VAVIKRTCEAARLLTVLGLGPLLLFADAGSDGLIQRMEKRYKGAQTLSVNFTEQYSILGRSRPPESGLLTLRKPGKMRWEYRRPEGKLFISDGKSVFLYTSGENRVEKVPLKDTEDMRAPLAFLLGRLDLKKEFRDFRVREGDGGTWLNASAKTNRVPYEKVDMLIAADGSVRQLKISGRDQSVLDFAFTDEKLNQPAPNEMFHFEVPPGAEVVDSVEFAAEEK